MSGKDKKPIELSWILGPEQLREDPHRPAEQVMTCIDCDADGATAACRKCGKPVHESCLVWDFDQIAPCWQCRASEIAASGSSNAAARLVHSLYERSGAGCCLHIVLDDGNVRDGDVEFCIQWARDHEHTGCEALGGLLVPMSEDQRDELRDRIGGMEPDDD